MLQRFSNKPLARYIRMSPEESIVWGRFLASAFNIYERYDYDLRVGTGILPDVNIPEPFLKDYQMLTQKRIDAVGYLNNTATIFEVKTRSLISPIGQLLGYKSLFAITYPFIPVVSLKLVCSSISIEDSNVFKQYGIDVLIF
jgi:hypothetical protein